MELREVINRGDSFRHVIRVTDDMDNPVMLDGWHGAAQIRRVPGAELVRDIAVNMGGNGTIIMSLSPADTADIPLGVYRWDLRIMSSQTNQRHTLCEGVLEIKQAVTE